MKVAYWGAEENMPAITAGLPEAFECKFEPANGNSNADYFQGVDLFLIGTSAQSPVKEIQRIFSVDKQLSIIVLVDPGKLQDLKMTLQLAPFVGSNSLCVAIRNNTDYPALIDAAARRTAQKRSFKEFSVTEVRREGGLRENLVPVERLGSFLEHAPMATLIISPNANSIQGHNKAARVLFPPLTTERNALLSSLLPPYEFEQVKSFILSASQDIMLEIRIGKRLLELHSSQVWSDNGDAVILLMMNDATERMLEGERIKTILEALPQMSWTSDPEGKIDFLSREWQVFTGEPEGSDLNQNWLGALHPGDIDQVKKLWKESIIAGTNYNKVARYKNRLGEYRWHLSRAVPIRNINNEIIRWVGTCTDTHDQVASNEELERKVAERTRALESSNAELKEFTRIASHDLQEPMRKISTFISMIGQSAESGLNESDNRYLMKIRDTAQRMAKILRDLLDYTSLDPSIRFERVNLNTIIGELRTDLELVIQEKNAVLETELLPEIVGSGIQLQQLFYNLINNALKFSRKDLAPVISIKARNLDLKTIQFEHRLNPARAFIELLVQDNGIGFDQKHADKIFTMFRRLHSTENFRGTGLGLALCRKIVANHDGIIFANSEPGIGTTFHVILPAEQYNLIG